MKALFLAPSRFAHAVKLRLVVATRRHTTSVPLATALNVALIHGVHGHVGHVATRHVLVLAHARATAGGDVRGRLLGRGGIVTVATIVSGTGFGGVEASL